MSNRNDPNDNADTNAIAYNDAPYESLNEHLQVPNLIPNFDTACTLLRMARKELRIDLIPNGNEIVNDFYDLLDRMEDYQKKVKGGGGGGGGGLNDNKFLIEIEGLDGSGKTTLCQSLADHFRTTHTTASSSNTTDEDDTHTHTHTHTEATTVTVIATKTPSKQLKDIRPLWDHRGGLLARAFYMMSNYVLEYELVHDLEHKDDPNHVYVILIDRWYASTLAYTVAYRPNDDDDNHENQKNMDDDDDNDDMDMIKNLPSSLFAWPNDLHLTPHLLLLLDIDPHVRQARVSSRASNGGGASLYNPWDDRLKDMKLGVRILQALKRIHTPEHVHVGNKNHMPMNMGVVNANETVEQVVRQAMDMVVPQFEKWRVERLQRLSPQTYFGSNPLSWWKMESRNLHLCNDHGKRCHHALWNLQVSFHDNDDLPSPSLSPPPPPVLKTVGLERIDEHCIYYWTCASFLSEEHSSSSSSSPPMRMASCLWMAGNYPTEQQWRAEGYVTKVTPEESDLLWGGEGQGDGGRDGYAPPPSLVAHLTACRMSDGDSCRLRPDDYEERVMQARARSSCTNDTSNDESKAEVACLIRFVPIRIEVLRGGPSTRGIDGYPQRLEWVRDRERDDNDGEKWVMRSILPFPTAASTSSSFISTAATSTTRRRQPLGVTIALMGCHTSGKTTIGKALAKALGWRFDAELGEVLRGERDQLQPGGHMYGDGSGSGSEGGEDGKNGCDAWDDLIHHAEVTRDDEASAAVGCCRVVETWHVGNSKWYQLRRGQLQQDAAVDLTRYKNAVAKHQTSSVVLLVNLTLSSSDIVMDRRKKCNDARERLPLADEEKECRDLFDVFQPSNSDQEEEEESSSSSLAESFGIPVLNIDNGRYGKDAMNDTLRSILLFIQRHLHKRI